MRTYFGALPQAELFASSGHTAFLVVVAGGAAAIPDFLLLTRNIKSIAEA